MGPCTANARRPTVVSRCRGTTTSCCVADLRRCLPTTSVTGVQQSMRYCGALPCRHLCMMTPSLYVTRSATSSQCRSSCKLVMLVSICCQPSLQWKPTTTVVNHYWQPGMLRPRGPRGLEAKSFRLGLSLSLGLTRSGLGFMPSWPR